MISTADNIGNGDYGRHPSPFSYVDPVLQVLQSPDPSYHLSTIEGFGDEVRQRFKKHLHEGARAPIRKTANGFSNDHGLDMRSIERLTGQMQEKLFSQEAPFSVAQAIEFLRKKNATVVTLILAVLRTAEAVEQRNLHPKNIEKLSQGQDEVSHIALPGEIEVGSDGYAIGSNHRWLYDNKALNYLRLIGGLPEITYDEVHSRGLYLFTEATQPTQFAHELTGYRNGISNEVKLIENKRVLEIGPGNGMDVDHFVDSGAEQVMVVDGSDFVLDRLRMRYRNSGLLKMEDGNPVQDSKVIVPGLGLDMHDALRHLKDQGELFDTIAAHSCFHYFDDKSTDSLLQALQVVIKPGGHLAFAVKAPGATLDGHGIKLFEDLNVHCNVSTPESCITDVRGRMWMNFDGQMRNFRSMDSWIQLLSPYFDVVRRTESDVVNYEAPGTSQKFYNFIARKKSIDLPTQI